jgi:glutamate-1-semialdehyde 2,1-aminomutase
VEIDTDEELTEVLLRLLENKISEVLNLLIAKEKVNLAKELKALNRPGVIFREAWFTPTFSKFAGERCGGCQLQHLGYAAQLAFKAQTVREQFQRLEDLGAKFRGGIEDCFKHAGLAGRVTGVGSLFRIHGTDRELTDYRSTRLDATESQAFARLVRRLLERGVLISPTGLGCVSTPMGDAELEWFLETFSTCLHEAKHAS